MTTHEIHKDSTGPIDRERQLQLALSVVEPDYRSYPRDLLVSNDIGFSETVDAIVDEGLPRSERSRSAGLVVGGSYLESLLPELAVDVVIVVDREPFALAWQRCKQSVLRDAPTPGKFIKRILNQKTPIGQAILRSVQTRALERVGRYHYIQHPYEFPVELWLSHEQQQVGDLHFLSSDERYRHCREAMLRTPIIQSSTDLESVKDTRDLSDALAAVDSQITFANFTNAWEHSYGDGYQEGVMELPIHPGAFIAYSTSVEYIEDGFVRLHRTPLARHTRGVAPYLSACIEDLPAFEQRYSHWTAPFHLATALGVEVSGSSTGHGRPKLADNNNLV